MCQKEKGNITMNAKHCGVCLDHIPAESLRAQLTLKEVAYYPGVQAQQVSNLRTIRIRTKCACSAQNASIPSSTCMNWVECSVTFAGSTSHTSSNS